MAPQSADLRRRSRIPLMLLLAGARGMLAGARGTELAGERV
jgi:hypothetical protein